MMNPKELYLYADAENIHIEFIPIGNTAFSLPNRTIGIDPSYETRESLAHEIGHILTGEFYSCYSDSESMRKAESAATKCAIDLLVPRYKFRALVSDDGYVAPWQVAEYFDVSYEFAVKAIKHWKGVL